MASAGWALQQAIYAALIADGELATLLGGPRSMTPCRRARSFPT